jgi:hypothetical protein
VPDAGHLRAHVSHRGIAQRPVRKLERGSHAPAIILLPYETKENLSLISWNNGSEDSPRQKVKKRKQVRCQVRVAAVQAPGFIACTMYFQAVRLLFPTNVAHGLVP